MEKYSIPTARYNEFEGPGELKRFIENEKDYPLVIKLDGLAAGKGVCIPENRKEALEFIDENVTEKTKVFVEDYLAGQEASILGISDGTSVKCLVAAQDHKRIFDGDRGPNTGGMGAYAPAPLVSEKLRLRIQNEIMQPTIDGMRKEGIPFKGVLCRPYDKTAKL
jgi:phosphoribosylamine--glycine ligase